MSYKITKASSIYVFRCGESGLYALTADRTGQILPSQIYPKVRWRFERRLTLRRDKNSARQEIINATLDAIRKRGFYLTDAAIAFLRTGDGPDIRSL
jgi:hypothetical protein